MLDSPQIPLRPRVADPVGRARRRVGKLRALRYDFRRPIQLSREHSRVLQLSLDAFSRQATQVFTSALRAVTQVTLVSIDQRTYAEYIESLPGTTYMTMFSADPLPGRGVLEIPIPALMTSIDHMLGGFGASTQPERPLTDIEAGVVRGFVERLLGELRYSLAEIVPLDPVVVGTEYAPQFAQVAGPADVVVVATFQLMLDGIAHDMSLCLQFSGLATFLNAAAAPNADSERERAKRAAAAAQLHEQFQDVPVEVAVRIRSTLLDPETLAKLEPGEVLRLNHPAAAPLDVTVEDTTFAHATPGAQGRRLAALIVSLPEKES